MDLALAIRTMIIKDEKAYVQAGAGIVYDSVPELEYEETLNKAKAFFGGAEMILLIDNYDSFTYNLYHQIAQFGEDIKIIRNDAITVEEIRALQPKAIVISPGPGEPKDAGIVIAMIRDLYKEIPILGICLGHQSIGEAFGATVSRAKNIMHGKTSLLQFEKTGLFAQFEREVEVMRYHSLIIEKQTLHEDFHIVATSADDGEIMAIQHKQYPVYGLQFHPESIGTELGKDMISMFLKKVEVLA